MSTRKYNEARSADLDVNAEAFIAVLLRHHDHVITASDLEEYYPGVDWTGKISSTWQLLNSDSALAPHLRYYGENKTRVFCYLSNPEDDSLLKQRIAAMALELEEPSEFFKMDRNEGLAVQEKVVHRWWKVAAIAGVAATAMTATGVAVYRKARKS